MGIAVITAGVAIAQTIRNAEKQAYLQEFIIDVKEQQQILQEQAAANDIAYGIIIEALKAQLDDLQELKKQSQLLTIASVTLVGISALLLIRKFRKK